MTPRVQDAPMTAATNAWLTLPAILLVPLAWAAEASTPPPAVEKDLRQTLALLKRWVHGRYNSSKQFHREIDSGVADDLIHREAFQLIEPVTVPALEGYVVFEQSSTDGSDDPERIFRLGLFQFFIDSASGAVRQREFHFKNPDQFKNAHRSPTLLAGLKIDNLTWDEGCDFYLRRSADGSQISGPMRRDTCRIYSNGLRKEISAEDDVVITTTEFWFLGRFVDEHGVVVWGNKSNELNKLVRVAAH